jgi:hypothetical protein
MFFSGMHAGESNKLKLTTEVHDSPTVQIDAALIRPPPDSSLLFVEGQEFPLARVIRCWCIPSAHFIQ